VTTWHLVQPPHGSVVKQPQSRAPVHPLGMRMHSGGRSQHPAQRPVMQISPEPQVLVPHVFPPAPAAPPAPAEPAPPPLCAPPPPEGEPPLAVTPPVADPPPEADPPVPGAPPLAEASPTLPPALPSLEAHPGIKTTATSATDQKKGVIVMSASTKSSEYTRSLRRRDAGACGARFQSFEA
jgi:hypothetical protein